MIGTTLGTSSNSENGKLECARWPSIIGAVQRPMIQASVREAEALHADLGTSPEERRERRRLRNGAQRKPEMAQSYPGRPVAGIIGGHRKARRQPATHAKPTDVQHDHRQHTEPPKAVSDCRTRLRENRTR